ncbi:MAG: hypothetical protein B7X29_02460 [Halothiobacillus sp. 13-55-115]|nr:MAG: hypothetical protein B7X29_02460 [Halothiobacillus sp. 13-55-115]
MNTTKWGEVSVNGKLGQQHADFFEAICFHAQNLSINEEGQLKILVDLAKIRRSTRLEGIGLKNTENELMAAVVEILKPNKLSCRGHLIDSIHPARQRDETVITAHNPFGGTRALWTVTLGDVGMMLLKQKLTLNYNPTPIAQIHQGAAQAIARLLLTHDPKRQPNGGFRLDTLIEQVCGSLSPSVRRDYRRYIRSAASQLAELGILIEGDRVKRQGKSDAKPANAGHLPDGTGHLPNKSPKRGTYTRSKLPKPAFR